jgi:hypothetical protein
MTMRLPAVASIATAGAVLFAPGCKGPALEPPALDSLGNLIRALVAPSL